jgi:Fe-S-cluster-containing hydrogenase component 2
VRACPDAEILNVAGFWYGPPETAPPQQRFQSCRLYNGEDKDLAACVRACPDAEILNVAGFWYGPPETAPPQQRDSMISFHKLNRAADMVRIHKSFGMHANCARVDSGGDFV